MHQKMLVYALNMLLKFLRNMQKHAVFGKICKKTMYLINVHIKLKQMITDRHIRLKFIKTSLIF